MIFNKNFFLFMILTLSACQKSTRGIPPSDQNNTPMISTKRLLASNVIVSNAYGASLDEEDDVDTETKILAENILLANGESDMPPGRLKSKDLKSAIVDELAPELATVLIGQWDVTILINSFVIGASEEQKTAFTWGKGVVTFNADLSASIDSGCASFIHRMLCKGYDEAAAGVGLPIFNFGKTTYKIVGSGVIIATVPHPSVGMTTNSVLTVAELTRNRLILVNSSVESNSSAQYPEVAVLTRTNVN